jgi:hypothetical protein
MRIIKIKESEIKSVVSQILRENEVRESNYMFFSNLEQIERQCKLLRNMDPSMIDEILNNGHDWADDHVTEAKVNMDQVFDFLMNETKGSNADEPVNADMNQFSLNEAGEINEKCWDGYKAVGSKMKNGKRVPNCVPTNESTEEEIDESKNKPTNPKLWAASLAWAKSKYDVCPSAYCNGAAAKHYKSKGGGWRKAKK